MKPSALNISRMGDYLIKSPLTPDTAPKVIEVRRRDGEPIEQPSPQGYRARRHMQFTEDDGRRGFTPGVADSTGRPGPTSAPGHRCGLVWP